MQSIFDAIMEWLKALLVEGIMENLGGLFTGVLRPLQDWEPLEIHMGRSLKYCCKICC